MSDQQWLALREYDAFKETLSEHYATKEYVANRVIRILLWLLGAAGVVIGTLLT